MNGGTKFFIIVIMAITITITTPALLQAAVIPSVYSADSFVTSYHDKPLSFERDEYGNFFGITESGKTFTQTYVTSSIALRLQKFSIDEVEFYISDRGIINAENDIEALSIYLVAVGWS